ncbi:hypothetical protein ZWY2020_005660, partial [Hordeum vulgare]
LSSSPTTVVSGGILPRHPLCRKVCEKCSMDITDADLVSDESLWALYERWCGHHNVRRDLDDKARRFSVFKDNARMIHQFNQGDAP